LPTAKLQELVIDFRAHRDSNYTDELISDPTMQSPSRHIAYPHFHREATVITSWGSQNLQAWELVCNHPNQFAPFCNFPAPPHLTLDHKKAYAWIPCSPSEKGRKFPRAMDRQHTGLKTTLTHLSFYDPVPVDSAFISPLLIFPNLVHLGRKIAMPRRLRIFFDERGCGTTVLCTPRLELLDLGHRALIYLALTSHLLPSRLVCLLHAFGAIVYPL